MRIGKVKSYVSKSTYVEDEIDRIAKSNKCFNCKKKRVLLCSTHNERMHMQACVNFNCFLYTNIHVLKSWEKVNQDDE